MRSESGRRSNPSPSDERKLVRMFRNHPGVTSRTGNSVYLAVVLVDGIMILHLKSAARWFKLGHSWCSYRTVIPNKGYRITLSFWNHLPNARPQPSSYASVSDEKLSDFTSSANNTGQISRQSYSRSFLTKHPAEV